MEYLCGLKKDELNKLDISDLRCELYKVENDISETIYQKIENHLSKEELKVRFSYFLQDYKNQLIRKERNEKAKKEYQIRKKKYDEEMAEKKRQKDIDDEIKRKNSLKYWLENYPDRFKNGTIIINTMCYQTYPCCHSFTLEYNDKDKIDSHEFSGDGRTILNLLKKYPKAKWSKGDKNLLEHFKEM